MKNELIQLAEYLEALEARIADLEQRYDILMQRSAEAEEDKAQAQLLSTLQDQVAQNTAKLNALGAALAEVNARLDDELELDDEEVVNPVVEENQHLLHNPNQNPLPLNPWANGLRTSNKVYRWVTVSCSNANCLVKTAN